MAYCYAITNLLTGLAASAFTNSTGNNDSTRARLNDGRMDKRYVVNSSVASGSTIVIDFGTAVAATGFALLNTNCAVQKSDAAVRVRGADGFTAGTINTNIVTAKAATTLNSTAPKNKDHVLQFPIVTKRYWELTFTWTGSVANFAIGELWAFQGQTQISRKSIYGGGEKEEMKTASIEFDGGNTKAYFKGGPIRGKRLPFQDLTGAQLAELQVMWRAAKAEANPFLWIESYESSAAAAAVAEQEVIYGRCRLAEFEWSETDYLLYQPPEVVIRSLGREVGA